MNLRRQPALDGVRGMAIGLVLLWHYAYGQAAMAPGVPFNSPALRLSMAWSGVDLFFVLSGFLIAGILFDNRQYGAQAISTFYVRRAARILPLYAMLLVAYVLASHLHLNSQWLFEPALPLQGYLTFTQNAWMAHANSFGAQWLSVTWSLAVEGQFYLLLPLIIFALPRRAAVATLILISCCAPLWRLATPSLGGFVLPWCRADAFGAGALIAVIVRRNDWPQIATRIRRAAPVGSAVLVTVFALLTSACVRWGRCSRCHGGVLRCPADRGTGDS